MRSLKSLGTVSEILTIPGYSCEENVDPIDTGASLAYR